MKENCIKIFDLLSESKEVSHLKKELGEDRLKFLEESGVIRRIGRYVTTGDVKTIFHEVYLRQNRTKVNLSVIGEGSLELDSIKAFVLGRRTSWNPIFSLQGGSFKAEGELILGEQTYPLLFSAVVLKSPSMKIKIDVYVPDWVSPSKVAVASYGRSFSIPLFNPYKLIIKRGEYFKASWNSCTPGFYSVFVSAGVTLK